MIERLAELAIRLPQRQLTLIAGGSLLILVAVVAMCLQKPISELRATRGAKKQYQDQLQASVTRKQLLHDLTQETGKYSGTLNAQQWKENPDQLLVRVLGELNRLSNRYQVNLKKVSPGVSRRIMAFEEVPFDIELGGTYENLMAWILEFEQSISTGAVNQFEISPGEASQNLVMRAQLVILKPVEK